MGQLVDGVWHASESSARRAGGRFVRAETRFRNWITADGAPGPSGSGGFPARSGRYHLFVSLACPWAHRTLIFRRLKGLEDHVSVSITAPEMLEYGWEFNGTWPDDLLGASRLSEIYLMARPDYSGRVSVPVLWDKERRTIVSNESSEIIRMFNTAFDAVGASGPDFHPADLHEAIETINERVYRTVNNGVYRCGFARSQDAYDEAFAELFDTLDHVDDRLSGQRFLTGARLTEADWRLFTTLIRFDAVYYGHFKCNRRRIGDYPALSGYVRDLYQMPGVAATVDIGHIKRHYYYSHESINPTRIVPIGPALDFSAPHGRDHLAAEGLPS